LAPHERIVIEEKVLEAQEQTAKSNSIDSLRDAAGKGYTVFRIAEVDLPNLDLLNERRNRASLLLKQFRESV